MAPGAVMTATAPAPHCMLTFDLPDGAGGLLELECDSPPGHPPEQAHHDPSGLRWLPCSLSHKHQEVDYISE
jgi:hypothetical protein